MQNYHNRYHRSSERRAFSLLDSILTVTLIGIAAAVSVPSLHRAHQRNQARCAAASLVASLQYLINTAVTTGTNHTITIDPNTLLVQCPTLPDPERIDRSFDEPLNQLAPEVSLTPITITAAPFVIDRHGDCWQDQNRLTSWGYRIAVGPYQVDVLVDGRQVSWSES